MGERDSESGPNRSVQTEETDAIKTESKLVWLKEIRVFRLLVGFQAVRGRERGQQPRP